MDNLNALLEKSLKEKKNLSQSSIKNYIRNITKLNDTDSDSLDFLKNVDKINAKLTKYKPNTIRNYLISIVSVLGVYKEDHKEFEDVYKKYYDIMMNKNKEIRELDNGDKTDTQKKNWMSWENILKKYKSLYDDVKTFINRKTLNQNQYDKLLALMILSLYVLIPPRRNMDYLLMYIVKKYNTDFDNDKNYLDYENEKFIFNVYKTSKKYDNQNIGYDASMKVIIDMYVKHHPLLNGVIPDQPVKFLVYYDGSDLKLVNSITLILNKLFEKNISSSMLRHIYLTDKYGSIKEQQKQDANDMGHNIQTQKDYIKK